MNFINIYLFSFYILGVYFYDFFNFNYTDEILILLLVIYTVIKILSSKIQKSLFFNFSVTIFIFLFYIIYSIIISSNTVKIILIDAIIQIKPYIAFYCTRLLNIKTNDIDIKLLKYASIFGSTILLIVFTTSLFQYNHLEILNEYFGHPSRFATTVIITAIIFFWTSKLSNLNIFLTLLILTTGIISEKSKFYGFASIFSILLFIYKNNFDISFKANNIFTLLVSIIAASILSYGKIYFYFIEGSVHSYEMFTRPALYLTSFKIFMDYLPFGSGFGSFATYASTLNFSEIYSKYGLTNLTEFSSDKSNFICDTFYPSLAQYGIVGLFIFCFFWRKNIMIFNLLKNCKKSKIINKDHIIGFSIIIFFIIESISDSTLTHNRGSFLMIILAITINNIISYKTQAHKFKNTCSLIQA